MDSELAEGVGGEPDPTQRELDRIAAHIELLVEDFLKSGRPCLLSGLGIRLGPDLQRLKELAGKGLSEFVRERFEGRYDLIATGEGNNVLQVIPRMSGETLAKLQAALGDPKMRTLYDRGLWTAFSVPASDKQRHFDLLGRTWRDADGSPDPDHWKLIDGRYLRRADTPYSQDDIENNLRSWSSDIGLDLASYIQTRPPPQPYEARRQPVGATALETLIESLDRRRLQEISLPLDVVAVLLKRR